MGCPEISAKTPQGWFPLMDVGFTLNARLVYVLCMYLKGGQEKSTDMDIFYFYECHLEKHTHHSLQPEKEPACQVGDMIGTGLSDFHCKR